MTNVCPDGKTKCSMGCDLYCQKNFDKAAEEGGLPALKLIQKLNGIAMSLAADLVQGSGYQFQGHDYLDRDYVCERVLQWRAEWAAISPEVNALSEQLRAADRASRQVANKAEVEPVAWLVEATSLKNNNRKLELRFDRPVILSSDFTVTPLYTTPPATTGASAVLTDERITEIEMGMLKDWTSMNCVSSVALIAFARAIERETLIGMLMANDSKIDAVAAQAGQVASVPSAVAVPIYQVATKQGFAWCDVERDVYEDSPSKTDFNRRIVYLAPSPAKESK